MSTDDLKAQVDNLIRIGIALSSQQDVDELLEMIVEESRRFTRADAGTLYTVSPDGTCLDWRIVQNDTLGTRIGGTSPVEIDADVFKPVALLSEGQANLSNVSAYVANTGETVSIPDVYEAEGFDFTGPRLYDRATGYRSQSMLVLPLTNHEDDIIGVLQLLNARDDAGQRVIPFSPEFEGFTTSLASQAAVAMTNVQLIRELRDLFDAFIRAIASAIDQKSPYTAGHVRRVAELTMKIAEEISRSSSGTWERIEFDEDELEELRIAAWMHDVGKITTPEYIVDKATKLSTIYDRLEAIRTRYELMKRDAESSALKKKLDLLEGRATEPTAEEIDEDLAKQLADLVDEFQFIERCNAGSEFMDDTDLARLEAIASKTYLQDGQKRPRLTPDELLNLSIRKGTLTDEERSVINNHAAVTVKLLSELPFSKRLRNVPQYAGGHHEKLNGQGYPAGLSAEQLSLQARVMAVADIFEALTASDRPYRKAMPLSVAVGILRENVERGELDGRIVGLLVDSGLAEAYAERESGDEPKDG